MPFRSRQQLEDAMRAGRLFLGLSLLVLAPLPAQAGDLVKIDRVIAKEPKYQGKPEYCLLVFGPKAKFRVWLVLDGAVLYVDRNGNGDLSQPDKRVTTSGGNGKWIAFRPGPIGTPDGKTRFHFNQLQKDEDGCDVSLRLEHRRFTVAGLDGPGPLRFAQRAQDAPIIHFLGPLTLQRFEPQPGSVSVDCKPGPLVRGQDCKLAFSLGTPGLGKGTFAKHPFTGKGTASAEIRFANGKTITTSLAPDY
jgi:hypothetical protein